ncbi:MAG: 16S rRNA (cytosine(1402)-N(4))-methyltransferase RsmH [Candidatus Paceibacterota bacterium]
MHIPVLLNETIEILNPQPGEFFIDGTIGNGGHAVKIFEKIMPNGRLLGVDLDKNNLEIAREKILTETKNQKLKAKNLILVHGNYADLPEILKKEKLGKADGLILDLGFSSEQLESGKGFSFQKDELLDMRYNTRTIVDYTRTNTEKSQRESALSPYESVSMTAAEVINTFSEKDLADIIYEYGEERYSRKIAKKIIEQRKRKLIKTTFDLVEIIKKSVPRSYERGRIHPATRTFQALRIYVNHELENLEKLLKNLDKILKGRAVIISFHSLEDRLVKNCFKELKKEKKAEILTKKPIRATKEEIEQNPRSRSAKMRAILIKAPNSKHQITNKHQ